MKIKLYDSLTKMEKPILDKKVNIYNCGPTVYNDIHIGNARPLIIFDVLYRFLDFVGYEVTYLHNLTDIDDKIIKAAKERNMPELELSEMYAQAYATIRKQLNIKEMVIEKVSDNIQGIIDYIDQLILQNAAYVVNGNVYFDTKSIDNYGLLSNRQIDEQIHGERVSKDDNKRNESDFVLWKKTNEGIQWDTKWSRGRPGWHTECVYLINKYFKDTLTIHGGGIDLKFPHHENENAQHCSIYHKPLANIWMHIGHINVDHQKMSKSLNNFILVKDILQTYEYQVVRWFMYQTNYANPLDFNHEAMDNAKKQINKLKQLINTTKTIMIWQKRLIINEKIMSDAFLEQLGANLNISNGITIIQNIAKQLNLLIRNKQYDLINKPLNEIINALRILGIEFEDIHDNDNIQLIKQYYQFLDNKEYEQSDKIRQILNSKGLL